MREAVKHGCLSGFMGGSFVSSSIDSTLGARGRAASSKGSVVRAT